MKKIVLALLLLLAMTGCGVKDIDGVFICEGTAVSTFDGVELTLYTEHAFYVTDGYLEKEVYSIYTPYDVINDYYNTTPEEYYNDLIHASNTWVSENGFSIEMPTNTGESIIVSNVTDYTDLSVFDEDNYPSKAVNKDKVVYEKFVEEYYPGCKLENMRNK